MVPAAIARALGQVAERFPAEASWAVTCGTALALHGLDYYPNDLDIFARHADAARLAESLHGSVVFPFLRRESGDLSSMWGRFLVDGVEVDIVGDFSLRGHGRDITFDQRHPCWLRLEWITVGRMVVPVFALQDLLDFYEALSGEPAKVALIRAAIAHGVSQRA